MEAATVERREVHSKLCGEERGRGGKRRSAERHSFYIGRRCAVELPRGAGDCIIDVCQNLRNGKTV